MPANNDRTLVAVTDIDQLVKLLQAGCKQDQALAGISAFEAVNFINCNGAKRITAKAVHGFRGVCNDAALSNTVGCMADGKFGGHLGFFLDGFFPGCFLFAGLFPGGFFL